MKGKLLAVVGVILFVGACVYGAYYWENSEAIYYTQIDNSKIKELDTTSKMKYEYALTSYDINGKKKVLKFKTSRELREEAYLKLIVRALGVYKWEEVQYDELPKNVQQKLS